MPLLPNQLLNSRYEIRAILGQGGMGAVYDGWDKNLGIRVAIKENLLFTEASQRQFEREAHMLASLRHSNLPGVIDHFYIAGQGQYLVMSFIEGEDLAQRLKRLGPLPEDSVFRWANDVLNALAYLHRRGIIHRDIKPNNIKVTPDGEAVLVDFGIAKETVDETGAMTTTGARALTPGFAPPEQYGGARTDARSDIYAFGATLYTLLSGEVPPDAISRLARPEKYIPLKRHSIRVNQVLAGAIDKALALDADDRWPSAEAMKAGLSAPAKIVAAIPRKSHAEIKTLAPSEAVASAFQPSPENWKSKLIVPGWIVGAIAVVVLAIVGAYVAVSGQLNPRTLSSPTLALPSVTLKPSTTSPLPLTLTSTRTKTATLHPTPSRTYTPKPSLTSSSTATASATATTRPTFTLTINPARYYCPQGFALRLGTNTGDICLASFQVADSNSCQIRSDCEKALGLYNYIGLYSAWYGPDSGAWANTIRCQCLMRPLVSNP